RTAPMPPTPRVMTSRGPAEPPRRPDTNAMGVTGPWARLPLPRGRGTAAAPHAPWTRTRCRSGRPRPPSASDAARPRRPSARAPPADEKLHRGEGHGPLAGEAPRTDRTEDERRVAADDRAAEQDPFLRQEQQLREEDGDVPPHDPGPRDPQDGSHRG